MVQEGHVENVRILEMMTDPNRKDLFDATPKLVLHGSQGYKRC